MENSDEQLTIPEKPTEEKGGREVRFYECTFCKRGFSNAQALGGHMNIHRKDKVKLKPSSNETTHPSLDTHKVSPPNWPWTEEAQVVDIKQLPLLAERSSAETQKLEGTEKGLSSAQGSSSELDLELRLGPDPQDSWAAKGTGKFFLNSVHNT